jgi:hypothetical protein
VTSQPDSSDVLIDALRVAQREGNPVADGDLQRWYRIIRITRRRWGSFTRRHPSPASDTFAARAEDLARALLDRCNPRPGTGRPLDITECRDLARRLAAVLTATAAADPNGGGIQTAWAAR